MSRAAGGRSRRAMPDGNLGTASLAGIFSLLQTLQTEQARQAVVITGIQQDVGDVVRDTTLLSALIKDGTMDGPPLMVRMAVSEQKAVETQTNLAEHRRQTEGRFAELIGGLGKIRDLLEEQRESRERERLTMISSVGAWLVAILCASVSALVAIFKK